MHCQDNIVDGEAIDLKGVRQPLGGKKDSNRVLGVGRGGRKGNIICKERSNMETHLQQQQNCHGNKAI